MSQYPPPNQQGYGYNNPYGAPPPPPMVPPGGQPPGGKSSLGLDANIAGLLSYLSMFLCGLGIILNLVFFFMEKENRFVRFHAMQALLFGGACIVLSILIQVVSFAFAMMDLGILNLLVGLLWLVVGLGLLVVLILCAVKAFQNQWFKLPVIGNLAESIAGK